MPNLTLTDEEAEALATVLEGTLSDLSYEIADTDRVEFRDQLKGRREVLNKILAQLKQAK
jgi:hypothetical protein